MSSRTVMLALDYLFTEHTVTMSERLMLILLAARVNDVRGDDCVWPMLARLSAEAGMTKNTARTAIQKLCKRGVVTLVQEGRGRGRPSVYRVEKGQIMDLLSIRKRSNQAIVKDPKRDPPVQVQQEVPRTGSTLSSAEADAVALADLWNRTVTSPIPKVRLPLSADRVRVYAKAWPSLSVDEWTLVFAHVNAQDWCRAPGVGDHPNWTATLDWLTKKPATYQRQLEKAQTAVGSKNPRTRAESYRITNERNAASVASMPMYTIGGRVDDEADD